MIIYIAGPYRSRWGKIGIFLNILKARKAARKVWAAGHVAVCPHMNSAFFDGICPDEYFLDGYIDIVNRCDCLLALKGWEGSRGTVDEMHYAYKWSMPIIYIDELNEFLQGGFCEE